MNTPREPAGLAPRPIRLGNACLGFLACLFAVVGSAPLSPLQAQAQSESSAQRYVQLVVRLDRPEDGYCIDIQGVGRSVRLDRPLTAHNCKPGAAPDGVIDHRSDGSLYFPAYDVCVTAMGVGSTLLPGGVLMARPCSESGPFSSPAGHKHFAFTEEGFLQVTGTGLCVVVGSKSAHTLSRSDRWRSLYLAECGSAAPEYSRWQLSEPRR